MFGTDRHTLAHRTALSFVLLTAMLASPAMASPPTDPPEHTGTGAIAGLVTDPAGAPAAEICVDAWGETWGGSTMSDPDGRFEIGGLGAGSYIVGFFDCAAAQRFPTEYYLDATTTDAASPVEVADDTVTRLVAQMDPGATISGRVSDDAGDAAPNVCVSAEPMSSDTPGSWTITNADGSYMLRGMRSGAHAISFSSCDAPIAVPVDPVRADASPVAPGSEAGIVPSPIPPDPDAWPYGYLPEYWQNAASIDDATTVLAIEGADVGGIDAVLQRASGIELRIIDTDGEPATSLCADAYGTDGTWRSSTYGDGWLTIGGLEPGAALVHVQDCGWGRYLDQWYEDARRIEDATAITIPALDAASITMTLRDAPMPDLAVSSLQVTPVTLRTDAADLPGPGTQRDVRAIIANEGDADAGTVGVVIDATTTSDGARDLLHVEVLRLPAGASTTITTRADLAGKVGDVEIRVRTCTWAEPDLTDNEAIERSYALVGGTGIGLDPASHVPGPFTSPPTTECESLLWWDGPVPEPKPVPQR